MATVKAYSDATHHEAGIDVDALLCAISEITKHEAHFPEGVKDPAEVNVDGRSFGTWNELAEAFELDIHNFSISEINN